MRWWRRAWCPPPRPGSCRTGMSPAPRPAGGSWVAPGSKVTILASAYATSPGGGAGGVAGGRELAAAAAALPGAVQTEMDAFWALNAFNAWPSAVTSDQWGQWYADLGILQSNQHALGTTSWGHIQPLLTDPAGLTTNRLAHLGHPGRQSGGLAAGQAHPARQRVGPGDFHRLARRVPGQRRPGAGAYSADILAALEIRSRAVACRSQRGHRAAERAGTPPTGRGRSCGARPGRSPPPRPPRACRCCRAAAGLSRSTWSR